MNIDDDIAHRSVATEPFTTVNASLAPGTIWMPFTGARRVPLVGNVGLDGAASLSDALAQLHHVHAARVNILAIERGTGFAARRSASQSAQAFSMSVPSMLSMSMNMAKAFPMKLWFPSIDHVTNEPVGVPARVSAQVAVDFMGFTNSSLMPTF